LFSVSFAGFTFHSILLRLVCIFYFVKKIMIASNVLVVISAPGQLNQKLLLNKREVGNAGERKLRSGNMITNLILKTRLASCF